MLRCKRQDARAVATLGFRPDLVGFRKQTTGIERRHVDCQRLHEYCMRDGLIFQTEAGGEYDAAEKSERIVASRPNRSSADNSPAIFAAIFSATTVEIMPAAARNCVTPDIRGPTPSDLLRSLTGKSQSIQAFDNKKKYHPMRQ